MARRSGKKGDYLAVDDYTGFTTYASKLKRDYWGMYAVKPLQRNLQEIATPLNDPAPVPFYRGPNYEQTPTCVGEVAPTTVGNTSVPTNYNNAAAQTLNLNPALPDMEVGCTFIVRPSGPVVPLQNIASAMRLGGFNNGAASNGTDTAHNSIKWFKNESGVTVDSIAVVWPGWYTVNDAGNSEANINGNLTITASLEYPSGTRTQILFNGSTTGTVTPGSLLQSDELTLISSPSIPAGAMAAIHTYITCSSGTKWPLGPCANAFNGGTADNTESGAVGVVIDKTMSGAPAGTSDGYFPCAVLSRVVGQKKVNFAAFGDSITIGAGDSNYDTSNNTSWIGRAASGNCPIIHGGVTGTTAQTNAANFTKRLTYLSLCGVTHCFLGYGSNDLAGTRTSAQLQADYLTMANAISALGIKVINYTLLPKMTNTGNAKDYLRASTQTPFGNGMTAGTGSVRHSYNTWVRSNPVGVYDYIETSDLLDANSSGVITSGGGYFLDGPISGLDQPYTGTVSAGATTTVIPTSISKANNYFASFATGYALFTSGTNNGVFAAITSSTLASGQITLTSALGIAPVNGDTLTLYSARVSPTNDGTHLNFTDNSNGFGGHLVLKARAASKIISYNT